MPYAIIVITVITRRSDSSDRSLTPRRGSRLSDSDSPLHESFFVLIFNLLTRRTSLLTSGTGNSIQRPLIRDAFLPFTTPCLINRGRVNSAICYLNDLSSYEINAPGT